MDEDDGFPREFAQESRVHLSIVFSTDKTLSERYDEGEGADFGDEIPRVNNSFIGKIYRSVY